MTIWAETDQIENRQTRSQIVFRRLSKRASLIDIVDRLALVNRDIEVKNARRWLIADTPSPANAWAIGEALSYQDDDHEPLFAEASGLLSLLWFEHFSDFIAVIACTDVQALEPYFARFMAIIRTFNKVTHFSPFDELPNNHEVLREHADPQILRNIAETGMIRVPAGFDFKDEADAINDRREALTKIWNMPPDLRTIFSEAGTTWFEDPGLQQEVKRTKQFPSRSTALQRAYIIARSNMTSTDVLDLMVDHLNTWFFKNIGFEPFPETMEMLTELVSNPDSPTSRQLLAEYETSGNSRR